jgi:glycosyltransferase involved in cell wall biosynthesis
MPDSNRKLAFLPWGDVFEDFYASIGINFDDYCEEFTGSWHIRLVEALKTRGVRTVVYYSSAKALSPVRRTHIPTGATICLTPVTKTYRAIYNRMIHPNRSFGYWSDLDKLFGESTGTCRAWYSLAKTAAPYLATRVGLLAQQIKADGCSAILCQDYEHPGFDRSILLGLLLRMPVYAIFQGGVVDWNRIGLMLRPLTTRACSGFIIAPAVEAERVRMKYGIGQTRIHRIPNPLDRDIWAAADRAEARAKFGISRDAEVVVWHGRVEWIHKGLDILLSSWEKVCHERQARPLHLALLGAGRDMELLRQAIAKLPTQNVTWIDKFVSNRAFIRSFLATGDVYAFPSRIEGMPNAPVEAMAAGLPVVGCAASGVHDIFESGEHSGGIIVSVGDIDAFAKALGRALDDKQLAFQLSKNAKIRAQLFSQETIGARLESVLFGHQMEARSNTIGS